MPPQPQQKTSFAEHYQFVQNLMPFPALTVMVWLRPDCGYDTVGPARLIPVTVFLVVISVLATPGNAAARPFDLLIFALLTFTMGVCQRVRRWIQINQRVRQHSYYLGTSYFDSHRVPELLRRNRKIARFGDPILVMVTGFAVFHFSRCLGMWLIFASFCLRAVEHSVHLREQKLTRDNINGMLHSEQQSRAIEEFEASSGWHRPKDTEGLPSGLGEDLEREITISVKQRKIKTNKNTIDI